MLPDIGGRVEVPMKKEGYYSSGQFARMAHITKKTLRYYDAHNILKPSYLTPYGARFYSDEDFARLQQILLLKYLGFSLEDIREMTINDSDYHFMADALRLQRKLVQDKIEQLSLVEKAIQDTSLAIEKEHSVNWSQMLNLIHLTGMEKSMKNQYQNASNLSARIQLHSKYGQNKQGWFPWLFEQCQLEPRQKILEIGCGDGSLWLENTARIPSGLSVTLSDISVGMIRDTRRAIQDALQQRPQTDTKDIRFDFLVFDCHQIPYPDHSFDRVLANHVLFYCDDLPAVFREISRVLKPGGALIASTYGAGHMKEINELVSQFDDRITLSAQKLYEKFGRENGLSLLSPFFQDVRWIPYQDFLHVTEPEALISYVLSCHGNQNQYIIDRYQDFRAYVRKKTVDGFDITKDAGVFYGTAPSL